MKIYLIILLCLDILHRCIPHLEVADTHYFISHLIRGNDSLWSLEYSAKSQKGVMGIEDVKEKFSDDKRTSQTFVQLRDPYACFRTMQIDKR